MIDRLRQPWTSVDIAVMAVGAILATLAIHYEAPEQLFKMSRQYEDWEVDEILSILLVGLPLVLFRWNRLLSKAHRSTIEAEALAQRIALHDALTGLPNRRSFDQHVMRAAADAGAGGGPGGGPGGGGLTILLLDLDRFKPVNDLRGHQAGDQLLREVAARLCAICPPPALVARLGGDEFVVVVTGPEAQDHGAALARRILDEITEPFDFDGWSASITCSVGIADWTAGLSASDLLRHADQAMYRAKDAGKDGHAHYDEALGEAMHARAALEVDLRRALDEGRVVPHFQPIYDIGGGRLHGFEVLARWHDPARGYVPPDVFIDVAEEIGLIDRLSDVMLDQACAALASWPTALPISFNLSPRQFSDPGLPQRILSVLRRHGIPGSRLEIEITERAVLTDVEVARAIIGELAAAGVRISLDDFGTGTSSLATLTSLPFSRIKIDRSFIGQVDRLADKAKIVTGVIALAESLGLEVTAEGIERPEELAFLARRNCALGQGYLLGRPQSAEGVAMLLDVAHPPAATGRALAG